MMFTLFHDPAARTLFADWPTVACDAVHALRLITGHLRDTRTVALIDQLLATSTEFAALWHDNDVQGLGRKAKRCGRLELIYQAFDVQHAPGQQLPVGTHAPASADTLAAPAAQSVRYGTRRRLSDRHIERDALATHPARYPRGYPRVRFSLLSSQACFSS
ncbi:hypothetical protein ACFWF7_21130 [Nocardia sp. NPDC060256]|uniref:MmyB family transcriptional regulator n=1 Tax=unclassified Nocardia TaxID=2637762 RepID=UPI00365132CE